MENLNLSNSELLQAFMDGELESPFEQPLFSALSQSTELRAEMRDLIAMRRAVGKDIVAFTPPLSATAAVFGALGFSASGLALAGGSWVASLWGKVWMSVAGVAFGSVATYVGLTLAPSLPSNTAQNNTATEIQQSQNGSTVQLPEQSSTEQSVPEQSSTAVANSESDSHTRFVTRYVYVPVADNRATDNTTNNQRIASLGQASAATTSQPATSTAETERLQQIRDRSNQQLPEQGDIAFNSNVVSTSHTPYAIRRITPDVNTLPQDVAALTDIPSPAFIAPEVYPKFWMQLRGLSGESLVNVPVQTQGGFGFNNMGVGFMYSFSANHALGAEIGREPFAMDFNGVVEGSQLRYEVHPSLLWVGVNYQYRMNPMSGFMPFGQVMLGGTNYGALAKSILGVQYSPVNRLRLMLGFETSVLRYSFQQSSFYTPKIGFTYGLSYQF